MQACVEHPLADWDENGCLGCWWRRQARDAQRAEWNRPDRIQHRTITENSRRRGKWAPLLLKLSNGGKGSREILKIDGLKAERKIAGKRLRQAARIYGFRLSAVVNSDGLSVMNVGPVATSM